MSRGDSTQSARHGRRSQSEARVEDQLFRVLQGDALLRTPERFSLAAVDEVRFGRRPGNASSLEEGEGLRKLVLGLDDGRVSSVHCRLVRAAEQWFVDDLRSKNGTLVNGHRVEHAELRDGDLLELGRTFFLFRTLKAEEPAAAVDEPGLQTLLPSLALAVQQLATVSRSDVPVIIGGETGTGKELVAAAVHRLSGRAGPFQAVNCGAISRHLLESELFGHRRGAFSGAVDDHPGLIRAADRGTLFLDEIGDLPLESQVAFLRVLQEGEVRPVGSTKSIAVDVRTVVATHRDLHALVEAGRFRPDLLARISGFQFSLPPLRARREDLGLLIAALLKKRLLAAASSVSLSNDAARALIRHDWPLNIRELEKCLMTAAVLAGKGAIELLHLPARWEAPLPASRAAAPAAASEGELSPRDEKLRGELLALLQRHAGNVTTVAREMGKARMQVQRWMKRFSVDATRFRGDS